MEYLPESIHSASRSRPSLALRESQLLIAKEMEVLYAIQREYFQAQANADKWHGRILLALKNNKDKLALQAKRQRDEYRFIAKQLQSLLDEQHIKVRKLRAKFTDLLLRSPDNLLNDFLATSQINNSEEALQKAITNTKRILTDCYTHQFLLEQKQNQLNQKWQAQSRTSVTLISSQEITDEFSNFVKAEMEQQSLRIAHLSENLEILQEALILLKNASPKVVL